MARNVGYVPQDGALFTTMSVRENLAFALEVRGDPPRRSKTASRNWLAGWKCRICSTAGRNS